MMDSIKRKIKKKKRNSFTMREALGDKISNKNNLLCESTEYKASKHKKEKTTLSSSSTNLASKFKRYKKKNKVNENVMNSLDFISNPKDLKLFKKNSKKAVNVKISEKITPTFSINDNLQHTVQDTFKNNFKINKSSSDKNVIKKKIMKKNKNKVMSKNKDTQSKLAYSNADSSQNKIEKNSKKINKVSLSVSNACDSNEEFNSVKPSSTKKSKNKNSKFKKPKMSSCSDSEDSEEDQIVRKELENLSVFKNIQKLLKKHPETGSSFEEDFKSSSDSDQDIDSAINCKQIPSSQCFNDASKTDEETHSESVTKKLIVSDSKKSEIDCLMPTNSEVGFIRAIKHENLNRKNDQNISEKSKPFRNKAREKLQAAKFRFLNEKLYTENGKDSFTYFQKNKDEFMDYHVGYSLQVTKWPMNPVDKIIKSLQNTDKKLIIADMGCGDAKIAQTLPHSVHSFDLVALNDYVTPCNISKVPLKNESIDIVVFCLSLMGTNLDEYLKEAYRILKIDGFLKIAEVESRIPDLDNFIKSIDSIGFTIQKKDVEHKLFIFLEFKKEKGKKRKREKKKKKSAKIENISLKPCLYKKR